VKQEGSLWDKKAETIKQNEWRNGIEKGYYPSTYEKIQLEQILYPFLQQDRSALWWKGILETSTVSGAGQWRHTAAEKNGLLSGKKKTP
jgi:hypothetical protein